MKKIMLVALMLSTITWELQSQKNEMLFLLEVRLFLKSEIFTNANLGLDDVHKLNAGEMEIRKGPTSLISRHNTSALLLKSTDQRLNQMLPVPSTYKNERQKSLILKAPIDINKPNLAFKSSAHATMQPLLPSWVRPAPAPRASFNRMVNPQFDLFGIQLKF